jgi:hypothetical protein
MTTHPLPQPQLDRAPITLDQYLLYKNSKLDDAMRDRLNQDLADLMVVVEYLNNIE